MQENRSTAWYQGFKFIQFMKNRAFRSRIGATLNMNMFVCALGVGQ